MPTLHVTEFDQFPRALDGVPILAGKMPGTDQVLTYTTSTAISNAFANSTRFIRVIATAKAHLSFGSAPTADVNDPYIAADVPEYFGVNIGDKLAAYDGSS